MNARGLIIGAPRSGSGKTSVTIGLLRALKRRGMRMRGAKSGPDYIDPGFHAAATGLPGVNLDSWAMTPSLVSSLLKQSTADADLLVIESAMGLFDGIRSEPGRSGAASDLARLYGLPVLLVLDISGQSQTAAAVAKGFAVYDPDVRIAGIILNRVASERHCRFAAKAIEGIGLPVVGTIMRDPRMTMPERHLGLVQASEYEALEEFIEQMADVMETSLDLDRIAALAEPIVPGDGDYGHMLAPPGQRIALAQDAAFTFLYPHLAGYWRSIGAEIVPFSPLADQGPSDDCDVCWLPGGYPELHAGRLAAAENFRASMIRFAESRAIHGECGGFMVLGEELEDAESRPHRMLGLLGHCSSFARRKMNLGYRQARIRTDCPIGKMGTLIRGHEFHYAQLTSFSSDEPLSDIADGLGTSIGPSGARRGHVTGTFFHAIARG